MTRGNLRERIRQVLAARGRQSGNHLQLLRRAVRHNGPTVGVRTFISACVLLGIHPEWFLTEDGTPVPERVQVTQIVPDRDLLTHIVGPFADHFPVADKLVDRGGDLCAVLGLEVSSLPPEPERELGKMTTQQHLRQVLPDMCWRGDVLNMGFVMVREILIRTGVTAEWLTSTGAIPPACAPNWRDSCAWGDSRKDFFRRFEAERKRAGYSVNFMRSIGHDYRLDRGLPRLGKLLHLSKIFNQTPEYFLCLER